MNSQGRNSANSAKNTIIKYDELRKLVNNGSVKLIDVRSHDEVNNSGKIGQSTVIPVATIKEALQLPEDEFTRKYGVPKPSTEDEELVFTCASGRRSRAAWEIAQGLGYVK
ncbi:thiosulfate:glutathione sulfurtransferase-like [Anneissia japonica]|uniref:thiosulfate:glutathione sulfurtransferase-like n=1 Tax=Anneissia japonica TaxID=1529436 RepID=UPI0014257276|nr:thiosulfate:glutathione sulfurtransferase-like [Anneissia japonica]